MTLLITCIVHSVDYLIMLFKVAMQKQKMMINK